MVPLVNLCRRERTLAARPDRSSGRPVPPGGGGSRVASGSRPQAALWPFRDPAPPRSGGDYVTLATSCTYMLYRTMPTTRHPAVRQSTHTNVVMIVLDDLGFADLGCFGSLIDTPNIDRLAQGGLRFNNFHATSICSASRACFLTGRNHHAVGMGLVTSLSFTFPGYTARIPKSCGTLPRLLSDSGYNTFAVGKWHLAPHAEQSPAGPFDRWPLGMGFDRFYGFLGGMTNQWTPELIRDNGYIDPPGTPDSGYHLTEDLASQAIRLIQDQRQAAPKKPFFLYFATGAMHFPHHVAEPWINRYHGRFDEGWEEARRQTFDRQRDLGVIPATASLTERPSWVPAWRDLPQDRQRLYARMMEAYAGFLTHTDAQIGRIVDFLSKVGALDDTLLIVVSDNGASADGGPHGMLSYTCDDLDSMVSRMDQLGTPQSANNHYSWGWAWASNTPFRLWKHYTWLGGVRVPMIAHWPAGFSGDYYGQVRSHFGHAIDLMPTVLEASGTATQEVLDGVTQRELDGRSLLPTFNNPMTPSPRDVQYFEMGGSRAIYVDGWKATTNHVFESYNKPADAELVEGSRDFATDRWSLFSISEDFSEANDLAADEPERLRALIDMWWHEAGRNQVLPLMDDPHVAAAAGEPIEGMESTSNAGRTRFVAWSGGSPIDTPSPFASGFAVTADIRVSARSEGVIASQHHSSGGWDWAGGWTCFMADGRFIWEFDFDGDLVRHLVAEHLPEGNHQLALRYEPTDKDSDAVFAYVDGLSTYTGNFKRPRPVARRPVTAGRALLEVGRGYYLSNPHRERAAALPFTGGVEQVVLQIPGNPVDFDLGTRMDLRGKIEKGLRID